MPDLVGQWLRRPEVRRAIILANSTSMTTVQLVISQGYAPDLNDIEIEAIGRDPFLEAAAKGRTERVVVTREVSSPRKQRANRKVPDVCAIMDVDSINDFELGRRLDFRIAWGAGRHEAALPGHFRPQTGEVRRAGEGGCPGWMRSDPFGDFEHNTNLHRG